MTRGGVEWLAPSSLAEGLALRAERGDEATVLAGGSFLAILLNQGFLHPSALLSLLAGPAGRWAAAARAKTATGRALPSPP